jgi:hypothetical protein
MSAEDDTYSTIFTALKHPIRRKILRRLQASPATYTELLNELSIENGLLNYHLESVKELLTKQENSKYTLNEFGRAGVQLLHRVEEPVSLITNIPRQRQGILIKILSIALIIILSFSAWSLYSGNQSLKSELTSQKTQVETLQSYIQTLTNRAPSYVIITNQARYYVGDTINATFSYVNPTNQTMVVMPLFPTIIRYSGHYIPDENYTIHEVIASQASSNWGGNKILPGHIYDIITMSFTASKAGTFEIRCNDLVKTIQVNNPITTPLVGDFGIYLTSNNLKVVSGSDIRYFNSSSYEFALTDACAERLRTMGSSLSGNFTIVVDGEVVLSGIIVPPTTSRSYGANQLVMIYPVLESNGANYDIIRIQVGYPNDLSSAYDMHDPRWSPSMNAYFANIGKLTN